MTVASTGLTATVGTYVLNCTPVGLAIGGRVRNWIYRRPTYSTILLPPSHGITKLTLDHPDLFIDLSTIVSQNDLQNTPPGRHNELVRSKLFAYLGQNSKKLVLNPYFSDYGMRVVAMYCLDPDVITCNDSAQLQTVRELTRTFSRLPSVQTLPTYEALHAKLITHT